MLESRTLDTLGEESLEWAIRKLLEYDNVLFLDVVTVSQRCSIYENSLSDIYDSCSFLDVSIQQKVKYKTKLL